MQRIPLETLMRLYLDLEKCLRVVDGEMQKRANEYSADDTWNFLCGRFTGIERMQVGLLDLLVETDQLDDQSLLVKTHGLASDWHVHSRYAPDKLAKYESAEFLIGYTEAHQQFYTGLVRLVMSYIPELTPASSSQHPALPEPRVDPGLSA